MTYLLSFLLSLFGLQAHAQTADKTADTSIIFVKPTLTLKEISVVDKVNAKQELSLNGEVADYINALNKNAGKVLPIKGEISLDNFNKLLK